MRRAQLISWFASAGAMFSFCCVVTQSSAQSVVTRQPAPFPEGMDTWYSNIYQKIAVHDERLEIGGWGDRYVALIRFDLSGLPKNGDIRTTATLLISA